MPVKGMCAECERRDTCKTLCDKAEEYVNQDHTTFINPIFLRDPTDKEPPTTDVTWAEMQGEAPELGNVEWELATEGAGLTDKQELSLYMYYWEGATLKEIAEYMGVNVTSIFKKLDRAKRRVKKKLPQFQPILEQAARDKAAKRQAEQDAQDARDEVLLQQAIVKLKELQNAGEKVTQTKFCEKYSTAFNGCNAYQVGKILKLGIKTGRIVIKKERGKVGCIRTRIANFIYASEPTGSTDQQNATEQSPRGPGGPQISEASHGKTDAPTNFLPPRN
jgi:predicted DNA-binding protein YlxM (UPF0122 family)